MLRDLERRRRRASYRARHRGTREMDLLLGRFCDARLAGMSEYEIARFERLLALSDPELQSWIMEPGAEPDADFVDFIEELRTFHSLTGSRA